MYLTPSDRDYLVRTVIGEAQGQSDEGMAAVAHVVMNRLKSGKYGRSPTEIVLAKGQFEPWDTRRDELFSIDAASPVYKKVASIVDDVIGGKSKDPTSGATHFLNEEEVMKRYGKLPKWAQAKGYQIGGHTFHYPDDPERSAIPRDTSILGKYTKPGALPTAIPSGTPALSPAAAIPPVVNTVSIFDKYTKKDPNIDVPPGMVKIGTAPPFKPGEIEPTPVDASSLPREVQAAASSPARMLQSTQENFRGGVQMMKEGGTELAQGRPLPYLFDGKLHAGGLLKAGGGALVSALSPVTAVTEEAELAAAHLTGNPEFAKRFGLVMNALVPSRLAARGANRLRPSVRAEEAVGGVPLTAEQLERLRSNPRLTPMDVNPSLRQMGMGIYTEPGEAKNALYSMVRRRADEAPEAVREAYTTMAGPAPNVRETMRRLEGTAMANAQKGFGEAFKDVKVVNSEPVIKAIDAELRPGVQAVASPGTNIAHGPFEQYLAKLRRKLTDNQSMVTDPARLHEIQSELRRDIFDFSRSTDGPSKKLANDLKPIHEKLVSQIDEATSGKYRPAREQYRSDKEITEAFERGTEAFNNRPGLKGMMEDSPDAWREWVHGYKNSKGKTVGAATAEELEAARMGARAAIEQKIMGYRHSARRGTDIDAVPYNQEKMEILFGKEEAKRLSRLMQDERDIAITNSKLIANSDTAERLAGREAVKVRDATPPSALSTYMPPVAAEMAAPFVGAPPGVGAGIASAMVAGRHIANRLGRRGDLSRNLHMADLLSRGGAEGFDALKQSMRRVEAKGGNRLTNAPLPLAYVPQDVRESRRVPLKKD